MSSRYNALKLCALTRALRAGDPRGHPCGACYPSGSVSHPLHTRGSERAST
jgi:hypothetical protein